MKNSDVIISMELENKASFSMTLTEIGSNRIGLRDFVEISAENKLARITDNTMYVSENNSKILRSTNQNKMNSYKTMYRAIGQKILNGESGDSLLSIASTQIALDIELSLEHS